MATKQQANKYKWDLSSYIKDAKMLNEEFEYLNKNYQKFRDFYNKFDQPTVVKQYLKFSKEFSFRYARLAQYIHHNLNTDISDSHFLQLKHRFEFVASKIDQTKSFISPQFNQLSDDYLKSLIQDKSLTEYKRIFEIILKNKQHKISEQESELLSKMSLFGNASEEIRDTLCDSEIEFEDAFDSKGKKHKVNQSNYILLLNKTDRELRKNAFFSIFNGFNSKNKTLSVAMNKAVLQDVFYARLTKFNSALEEALFWEEVPRQVYDNLIKNVSKNVKLLHRLVQCKKKLLNIKDFAYYDMFVPIFKSSKKYSIEQSQQIITKALDCLGQEYINLLNLKFGEKSIDYLPKKNKVSGAYSSGSYGCPSIVLMNYEQNVESVYTLAHELGHCLHSELSNKNQPQHLAHYTIFSAEVASITNEILLHDYLVATSKNSREIAELNLDLLDKFRSTVFRQTMFAEFEQFTHETVEQEKPLTYVQLNQKYYQLNKKYFGNKINLPKILQVEWSRIPHFYSSFYVYKYATGFVSALAIVQKIKKDKDFYAKYLNFLKSGNTKPSVQLLKEIGIDLTADQPFELAFEYMEQLIKSLESK